MLLLASSHKCFMFHREIQITESAWLPCFCCKTAGGVAKPRCQCRVSVVCFPCRWKTSTWALTAGWAARTAGPSRVSRRASISVPTPTRTRTTCTTGALWYVHSSLSPVPAPHGCSGLHLHQGLQVVSELTACCHFSMPVLFVCICYCLQRTWVHLVTEQIKKGMGVILPTKHLRSVKTPSPLERPGQGQISYSWERVDVKGK